MKRLALVLVACSSPSHSGMTADAASSGSGDAPPPMIDAPAARGGIDGNRDRLLATYLAFLETSPDTVQSNGLSGSAVSDTCMLWTKLDASSQATFLTLTARLGGSHLTADQSTMLDHIVKLYRVSGGMDASGSDPGSCGGGEYNRMIMSEDQALFAAQVAFAIDDIPAGQMWRDSHDLGGPHAPFDKSDETNQGAPRGQTQYFSDPTSTLASSPLGRLDLMTLVDPYALEMDQDYDCVHNSNPECTYTTYGPLCAIETAAVGVDVYTASYGSYGSDYTPCP